MLYCGISLQTFCLLVLLGPSVLALKPICLLPKDPGNCRALGRRFYFNSTKSRCEVFEYGGCEGNANNFKSLSSCQETCSTLRQEGQLVYIKSAHCLLPPTYFGNGLQCRGYFPAFTFNAATLKCQRIIYGGCGATPNLYFSLEDCLSACTYTQLSPEASKVMINNESNKTDDSGPLVQGALVMTKRNRGKPKFCYGTPLRPGTKIVCLAYKPMFTFNSETGKCESYIYGGCSGSFNLFHSMAECEHICGSNDEKEDKGSNNNKNDGGDFFIAMFSKYNPFRKHLGGDLRESRSVKDVVSLKDICRLPPTLHDVTVCPKEAHFWTYNFKEGECMQHTTHACEATANSFRTERECWKTCGSSGPPKGNMVLAEGSLRRPQFCNEGPVKNGNGVLCKAYIPMVTFNSKRGVCEEYIYGGCKGSENLFRSMAECQRICGNIQ